MVTTTTNYGLQKPAINDPADQDLWGGYLNESLDTIDAQLKIASDHPVVSKTGIYTITASDQNSLIAADATSAAFTISLPVSANIGRRFEVKNVGTENDVTISPNGPDTIDGENDYVLSVGQSASFTDDGSGNWVQALSTVGFASSDEFAAAVVDDKAISPALFGGDNQDLSAEGYAKLPGGLIFQWGETQDNIATDFPIPFNSVVLHIGGNWLNTFAAGNSGAGVVFNPDLLSLTGFTAYVGTEGSPDNIGWFAIGA